MSTVIRPNKGQKDSAFTWYQDVFLYLIIRCFLHYLLYSMGSDSILSFWGILQHGGVYILEHSSGKYSIYCAQPRRCWRNAAERSTVDLDDSDTPTSGMLSRPDRSSLGIKSLKIALKLGNLGQNQVKLNFKDRRSSWGRLTTLRFLIALYRAGWAVMQLQIRYHKLRIIQSNNIRERTEQNPK